MNKAKALIVLLGLFTSQNILAANATLIWIHPTKRVDGTVLRVAQIKQSRVEWGTCTGTKTFGVKKGQKFVLAPAKNTTIYNLDKGTYCFRVFTILDDGLTSRASNVAKKYIS